MGRRKRRSSTLAAASGHAQSAITSKTPNSPVTKLDRCKGLDQDHQYLEQRIYLGTTAKKFGPVDSPFSIDKVTTPALEYGHDLASLIADPKDVDWSRHLDWYQRSEYMDSPSPGHFGPDEHTWAASRPSNLIPPGGRLPVQAHSEMAFQHSIPRFTSTGSSVAASSSAADSNLQEPFGILPELLSRLSCSWATMQQRELSSLNYLADDAAFESVAAFHAFAYTPGTDAACLPPCPLRDNLLASHRLLEFLHDARRSFSLDRPVQNRCSKTASHHLVLTCYILLLGVYDTLLAALQHDVASGLLSSLGGLSAPSLAKMRLFMLVQLSSYSIDGLHHGVNRYLVACANDLDVATINPQIIAGHEDMVQGRLDILRQTLLNA